MSVSSTEIIIVVLVALIVLGPKQLPEAMRTMGKAYREVRNISNSVQREIKTVVDDTTGMFNEATGMVTDTANTFTGRTGDAAVAADAKRSQPAVSNDAYRPADEFDDEMPALGEEAPADEALADGDDQAS